jgi:hypothetical protein
MINLRPNAQRAEIAITLIWIVLAMEVISLISGYLQYDLLQTVANGGEISMDTANANDTREQIIAIIYLIVYLVSIITFIRWFRRAYFNLHQKITYLLHSEGWAAGSWFVPIINLYRPYQIMKELYNETKELLTKKGISFNQNFNSRSIGWWWTLWIMSGLIGQFIFRYSTKAESIDELITGTVAGIISNIVAVPLALITIKIIKDYSEVEPLLNKIRQDEEIITHSSALN